MYIISLLLYHDFINIKNFLGNVKGLNNGVSIQHIGLWSIRSYDRIN